jgi:hypothetical protein
MDILERVRNIRKLREEVHGIQKGCEGVGGTQHFEKH